MTEKSKLLLGAIFCYPIFNFVYALYVPFPYFHVSHATYNNTAMTFTKTLILLTTFFLRFSHGQLPYGQDLGYANDWTGQPKQEG